MGKFQFETNPAFEKLGDDTRKSVTQAFEAMSQWRNQVTELGEKNSNAMFDKLAEAARSLGWPTDFVELSRKQIMSAAQMQTKAVDQVMEVWEKQIQSIGKMPQMPNVTQMPNIPGFDVNSAMNPMQMWMQAADMWQKNWQQAFSAWTEAQSKMMKGK